MIPFYGYTGGTQMRYLKLVKKKIQMEPHTLLTRQFKVIRALGRVMSSI